MEFIDNSNMFIYAKNRVTMLSDPWGLLVEIHSRYVHRLHGLAAHTYVTVTYCDAVYTFGSYEDNGINRMGFNNPVDVGTERTASVVVLPPPNMSQDEWDRAVLQASVLRFLIQINQPYLVIGGDGIKKGNCHTTTRSIIEDAGGEVPATFDPPGFNPGLHNRLN
jgi:hypothetical protein